MAVFTFIAAKIVTALGFAAFTAAGAATFATLAVSTLLSVGASRLLMKRQMRGASSGGSGGARIQLPPATENKLPVIYGSAYIGGSVTDAKISSDNKTMWYCVAMAEVTDTGGYTFDTSNIYYNGLKVQFGSQGVVTGLINNTTPATIDTKMSGQINIYLFPNGATTAGQNTTQTAQQIMQDSQIPAGQRWTSTDLMTDCAFIIVKVKYNPEKGTTSLGGITARVTNSLSAPGACIKDYMENTRYGCAIPTDQIDTASLTALDTYSAQTINYGTGTQQRYRLDGPLDTGTDCLSNLQIMVDSADSWLQYNEFLGKWSVIINQSYTDYTTISNLFLVDASNLVGGIDIAPINLNETYNQLEVAYPNAFIRDQTDYQLIKLQDYVPGIMSPNEATNKLDVDYPIVNNSVQSIYLGVRRLLQGREDLTVTFQLDYSGIQVQAGDVIRIKQEVYGWDTLNSGEGKLFRVANVAEEKYQDGSLGVRISAFEYNDTIYADRAILNFQPDPNLGIANPNIMDAPLAPRIFINEFGRNGLKTMEVVGLVPNVGLFNVLEFNYGTSPDVETHRFCCSTSAGGGDPLTGNLKSTELLFPEQYTILTLDDGIGGAVTDWSAIGATFVDLSSTPFSNLIIGKQYIIVSLGTTDFTSVGAAVNAVGTVFIATGIGEGTGTAYLTDFVATGTTTGTGTAASSFTLPITDLLPNIYYWSLTARNETVGIVSPASLPVQWSGPNVTGVIRKTLCNVNSTGTTVTYSPADNSITSGGYLTLTSGDGFFGLFPYIASITSDTQFELAAAPLAPLVNACIDIDYFEPNELPGDDNTGGVGGDNIQRGAITIDNINSSMNARSAIADYTFETSEFKGSAIGWVVNTPRNVNTFGPVSGIVRADVADQGKLLTNQYFGTTLDAYPYYAGTSSTADGYNANSTGSITPALAAQLGSLTNGSVGWYVLDYSKYDNGLRIPQGEYVEVNYLAQIVSNIDATIQLSFFLSTSLSPMLSDSEAFATYNLKAGEPLRIPYNYTATVVSTVSSYNTGAGIMIRLLTSGATVFVPQGDFKAYRAIG